MKRRVFLRYNNASGINTLLVLIVWVDNESLEVVIKVLDALEFQVGFAIHEVKGDCHNLLVFQNSYFPSWLSVKIVYLLLFEQIEKLGIR